jgi:TetR/AcrR family transcriptional regulator, regulator of cefoperazone and chloramphenicol sensitivity
MARIASANSAASKSGVSRKKHIHHDEEGDVRRRLLSVGLRVFAEKGYERAGIREICALAGSNLAAVNYYFGGKARFYREVSAYGQSLRLQELQRLMDSAKDEDPWETLSRHVEALISYSFDSDMFHSAWLYLREYVNSPNFRPASYPDASGRDPQAVFEEHVQGLMAKLLGPKATVENMALVRYTYASLSLFLLLEPPKHADDTDLLPQVKSLIGRERLRDHIMALVRQTVDSLAAPADGSKQ